MSRPVAVALSLLVPGGGQVYRGHGRRGVLILAGLLLIVLSVPWARMAGLVTFILFELANLVDAGFVSEKPARHRIWWTLALLVTAILIWEIGVRGYVIEGFKIPSGGMLPSIQIGDHIYVAKWRRTPARGDAIVFVYPVHPDSDLVKRVVAIAGDRVSVRKGVLYLNDKPVPAQRIGEESYWDRDDRTDRWIQRTAVRFDEELDGKRFSTYHDPRLLESGFHTDFPESGGSFTVPEGTVFVLGDNRENSHDSRYWGALPLANVKGKALFVWWSSGAEGIRWDRIGKALDR